ncbi:hypothetical protein HDU88_004460 [Geranomyces variabilis]|nr:hypothetical protein HDU88_004460 [Geranomyces variabilis]
MWGKEKTQPQPPAGGILRTARLVQPQCPWFGRHSSPLCPDVAEKRNRRRLPYPAIAARRSYRTMNRRVYRSLWTTFFAFVALYLTFTGLWWCHTVRMLILSRSNHDTLIRSANSSTSSASISSPTVSDTAPGTPDRVAVCFFGLTRSLRRHTFPSIREQIFNRLKEQGYEYDVFLHTYRVDKVNNYRSGEHGVATDPHEWALLDPLRYEIEEQDAVDSQLEFAMYERFGNAWSDDPTPGSLRNLLRQLRSVEHVQKLMEDYSKQSGVKYRYVMFARPDVQYEYPGLPQLDAFGFDDKNVGVAYEDRAAIGTMQGTKMWATRRASALSYMNDTIPARPLHSESLVRYHLTVRNNITVSPLPLCFQRVRSNGRAVFNDLVQCRKDAWRTSPWTYADE